MSLFIWWWQNAINVPTDRVRVGIPNSIKDELRGGRNRRRRIRMRNQPAIIPTEDIHFHTRESTTLADGLHRICVERPTMTVDFLFMLSVITGGLWGRTRRENMGGSSFSVGRWFFNDPKLRNWYGVTRRITRQSAGRDEKKKSRLAKIQLLLWKYQFPRKSLSPRTMPRRDVLLWTLIWNDQCSTVRVPK